MSRESLEILLSLLPREEVKKLLAEVEEAKEQ
jgi:hypothetical protein